MVDAGPWSRLRKRLPNGFAWPSRSPGGDARSTVRRSRCDDKWSRHGPPPAGDNRRDVSHQPVLYVSDGAESRRSNLQSRSWCRPRGRRRLADRRQRCRDSQLTGAIRLSAALSGDSASERPPPTELNGTQSTRYSHAMIRSRPTRTCDDGLSVCLCQGRPTLRRPAHMTLHTDGDRPYVEPLLSNPGESSVARENGS